MLYISHTGLKGRGVFSDCTIERGEVIERCPILEIPPQEIKHLEATMLYNYYFTWGKQQKSGAVILGLGSLYNHSYTPNASYVPRLEDDVVDFIAIKKILSNDEVLINYNGSPNDKSPLWDADKIDWQE